MNLVVDAGIVAMWFLPEPQSQNALLLLGPEFDLAGPDLIRVEVASALLKAARQKWIGVEHARRALDEMSAAPVRLFTAMEHVNSAYQIAHRYGGSLYDAIYISLAQFLRAPVITNDVRLSAVAAAAGVRGLLISDGPPTA